MLATIYLELVLRTGESERDYSAGLVYTVLQHDCSATQTGQTPPSHPTTQPPHHPATPPPVCRLVSWVAGWCWFRGALSPDWLRVKDCWNEREKLLWVIPLWISDESSLASDPTTKCLICFLETWTLNKCAQHNHQKSNCQNPNSTNNSIDLNLRLDYILTPWSTTTTQTLCCCC
jgi:hypothetical protein